jgi:serine protease AprX
MRAIRKSLQGQTVVGRSTAQRWWTAAFVAVVLSTMSVPGLTAQGQGQGQGQGAVKRAKVERALAERMAKKGAGEKERVILSLAPGKRTGLLRALQAQGVTVGAEFSLIEALAADIPVGLLRALEQHPDVLSVSSDADIQPAAIASTVTGSALGTAYSLRSTLGIDGPSQARTFQQGANGYISTVDGYVTSEYPSSGFATASYAWTEQDDDRVGMLLRFENMFGSGTGQIPAGATIKSVSLRIGQYADGSTAATASLYRMLTSWSASASWNTMLTSGAGIQFDNVEASSSVDASISNLATTGLRTFSGSGLAATVQAWSNGAPNNGWILWQNNANEWRVRTSEDGTVSNRPLLTVEYTTGTSRTGAGVTVAVIDSGMLLDGGPASRLKTSRDFTTGLASPSASAAADPYGHGTHVASLIGSNQADFKGVSPNVSFVNLRVLNSAGGGYTSHVLAALQWAVANRAAYGIDIINVSLGHPIFEPAATDPLVQAVEAASRAGIVVVASAGNYGVNPLTGQVGYGGTFSPGNAPSAITVGAVRTFDTTTRVDDLVAEYSSRGPTWYDAFAKPDIVAPGHRLLGAAATSQLLYQMLPSLTQSIGGRPYVKLSGSSMAAGVVSGSVALLIEEARATYGAVPPVHAMKAMLQTSALPMADATGTPYDVLTQGAGALNPIGALSLAEAINPTVPAGGWWLMTSVPTSTTIDGQNIVWGNMIVWGNNIVWGNALYENSGAWANNIVWGNMIVWGNTLQWQTSATNIVWGNMIVWGNNIVWGNMIVWGNNIVWGNSVDPNMIVWGNLATQTFGATNIVWGPRRCMGAVVQHGVGGRPDGPAERLAEGPAATQRSDVRDA